MRILAVAVLSCLPFAAVAQEFEVASIKVSGPPGPGMRFGVSGGPGTSAPGTITWSRTALVTLIATAYEVRPDQIANPQSLTREAFDLIAKLPVGATKEQVPAMLRNLLAQRFHLTTHADTRETSVYLMSVAKSGSKLKTTDPRPKPPGELRTMGPYQVDSDFFPVATPGEGAMITLNGSVHLNARAVTTAKLANLLTADAGRPVIDGTGLTGVYDVRLIFSPAPSVNNAPPPPGFVNQTDAAPEIFAVVQRELGLKLAPAKAPVKFIVVDHMDKTPVEN